MKTGNAVFLAGLLLVVVGAVMEIMGKATWSWLLWVVVVAGLAVGWLNITKGESSAVMIAYLALTAAFTALIFLPEVGTGINVVSKWLLYMLAPATAVVAGKIVYGKIKK